MADQSLIDRAVSPPQAPSVIDSALSPAQPASKIDDAIGTSQPTQAFQSDDAQAAAAQATSIGPQPVDVLDKALTKKLRDACASATNQIAAASNLCREIQLHPREPSQERAMNSLFQVEEPSIGKRIAIVFVGVMLLGSALWVGIAMVLRVASGQ
jgi:hypothetical protein